MAVGVNVGSLYARLMFDISQFMNGTRQVQSAMKSTRTSAGSLETGIGQLKKALGALGLAWGTKQVLDFGRAMWKVGIESQANQARFESVFGAMGADLKEWAKANTAAFGMAEDSLQGYLANIANLLIPMGFATDEAAKQSRTVLELANAWSAYWGGSKSVEEAIEAITKGMLGQTRGLIGLGMKLTDEAMAAEVARLGLAGLTGEAKVQAEALARLNIIRDRSNVALDVEAQLAEGALGAQRKLAAAIDTLKDNLGDLVVQAAPAIAFLADLVGIVGDMVGPGAVEEAGQAWQTFSNRVASGSEDMNGALRDLLVSLQPVSATDQWEDLWTVLRPFMEGTWLTGSRQARFREQEFTTFLENVNMAAAGAASSLSVLASWWLRLTVQTGLNPQRFASAPNVLGEHVGVTERMAGTTRATTNEVRRALTQPFDEAFRETTRIIREGFGAIGNLFVTFEIPEISKGEIAQNLLDWQEAQNDVAELMAALGAAGLASYGAALAAGLSSAQLAAIAAVWGGDLAYIQSLMPQYGPGGMLYQGRTYFGGGVDQPGSVGDYSASSYATGHPSSGSPATPADPGWGMGGNRRGGGKDGDINVYVGQAVGDETSIERMVTTAIRRARQRGNVRYYT